MTTINRIKTYIEGFDEKIDGGIPVGSNVIISGGPGTMKSSLAYYILYQNAIKNGMSGLYLSVEQQAESLIKQMEYMELSTENIKDKIYIYDWQQIVAGFKDVLKFEPEIAPLETKKKQQWLEIIETLTNQIKSYQLFVLDSISTFEFLSNIKDNRKFVSALFQILRNRDITTIMILEKQNQIQQLGSFVMESYLADANINLRTELVQSNRNLIICCEKMRISNHSRNDYILYYEKGKFYIQDML